VERGALDIGDEPLHLGRIVERVVASERPRWSDVEVVFEVPADLPSVAGEETYVEQVLRNLLDNAAKYGGTGTTVLVQTEAVGHDVVLRVLDEGPGVDEAEAPRLFELFYRAPSTAALVAGAGIGLFVCRQLVEAMGGTIRAERRREQGSAFIVTLPRYEDDGAA
jgi:two-component system sensor histidine kinase KdpD